MRSNSEKEIESQRKEGGLGRENEFSGKKWIKMQDRGEER
jgi:hypothetical protein